MSGVRIESISPMPTEAERAAILAALESLEAELWPVSTAVASPAPSTPWRYAGRPWRRRSSYGGWA